VNIHFIFKGKLVIDFFTLNINVIKKLKMRNASTIRQFIGVKIDCNEVIQLLQTILHLAANQLNNDENELKIEIQEKLIGITNFLSNRDFINAEYELAELCFDYDRLISDCMEEYISIQQTINNINEIDIITGDIINYIIPKYIGKFELIDKYDCMWNIIKCNREYIAPSDKQYYCFGLEIRTFETKQFREYANLPKYNEEITFEDMIELMKYTKEMFQLLPPEISSKQIKLMNFIEHCLQ